MPEGVTGKFDRIEQVSDDPRLMQHRFLLSEQPELREKLHTLRVCMEELQQTYPEIITLQVLGSHTKGYADASSDFDLSVPLNEKVLDETGRHGEEAAHALRKRVAQALGVDLSQVSVDFYQLGGRYDHPRYEPFLLSLGNGLRPYREAIIATLEKQALGDGAWKDLMTRLWERENLYFAAELMSERKKLYPMTLKEARAYFLPLPKNGS